MSISSMFIENVKLKRVYNLRRTISPRFIPTQLRDCEKTNSTDRDNA